MNTDRTWTLFCAIAEEYRAMRRILSQPKTLLRTPVKISSGQCNGMSVFLIQTGIGAESVAASFDFAAERFPINHVLSVGLCGGLTETLSVGDLLVPTEVIGEEGETILCSPFSSPPDRPAALSQKGRLLTTAAPIFDSKQRHTHSDRFDADGVDMESFHLAKQAQSRGLPFQAIRSVSDDHLSELPAWSMELMRKNGELNFSALTTGLLRNPSRLLKLRTMQRHSTCALQKLTAALESLLKIQNDFR